MTSLETGAGRVDLRDTELEQELRAAVRPMLEQLSPPARVLARAEAGEPHDQKLWSTLAGEMGLAGLAISAQYGGGGASLREVAVVMEELGRAIAPVPYLGSAVLATVALQAVDAGDLLGRLADGSAIAALAVPFTLAPGGAHPAVGVVGDALTGQVRSVADALAAQTLLVPTETGLYAVPADAPGLLREPVSSLDLTRPLADLTFSQTPGRRLADGTASAQALTTALTAGAALLASEQLGVAQWCLDTTVEYVKSRHQFGRPVGSFQAVKHRLADCWVELSQARAVARYAAACLSQADPDVPVAAALAQAYCAPVAVRAAEMCVQLHGGIGFTWEHPAHLFLKRAKSGAVALGSADRHRTALAHLVDLPQAGSAR